ncbi:PD-(D/E)XK nuclease family protein [bacterium]|nr:PD-(D/E)XK nuclease family protein [bacterium]MBU4361693.1 PD-(D/E)XK nuclease family protein [bacterium]MBU4601985.1 PD-(D/E)XK nuclease family protein [bacterium]
MHPFLAPLKRICRENLTGSKNLIMPSYLDGNALKKSLSREGFFALNLNITTIFDLARDYCDDYISKNKLKILDNSLGQIFLLQILKKLSRKKLLDYFQPPTFSPGISRSIYLAIKELRIAGFSSRNFPHPAIVNPQKSEDLLKIMQEYEKILKKQNYIDEADIYLQAIKYKKKNQQKKETFIVPSNIELNYLEEIFFRKIILPGVKVVYLPAPRNLKKPASFYFSEPDKEEENYPENLLDYLYNINKISSNLPGKFNVEFIQSHGEFNEVKTIIRKIKSQNIPLDEVSIFYTVQEPYSQYLYQLSRQYSFHITFGNGISIKNTSPAKLFFALIDWIRDNYSITKLYFLLTGGNFEFKNQQSNPDIPTPQRVASLLRNSPIGHKRNRYIKGLDLIIKQLKSEIEQVSEDRQEGYHKKIKDLFWIREFITQIFHELPQENFDYTISPKQVARGLINIVTNYSRIDEENNLDQEAIKKIKERLTVFIESDYPLPNMPVNEVLTLIADFIKNERVNCSEPRGGLLHTASYKKGIWLNRPYNFIVGMDSAKFPDSAHDGSILLDAEKKNTGRMNQDKGKDNESRYKMLQLIASLKGKIILSYSRFDTQDNRELAPSSLMLQLYRLKTGDEQKDYSDFYRSFQDTSGFIPGKLQEILDSADWFLYSTRHNLLDIAPLFERFYPALSEGFYAARQREQEELNRFNGKVNVEPDRVDPRLNRGLIMSSSRLELIAFCPYLYFLKYVLKIVPPKEMVENPGVWLEPSEKGIIFHQIFEKFYGELKKASSAGTFVSPSYKNHWPILEEITLSQLKQKRKRLAPPNNLVYQHESKEILDSCRFFLHCEEEKYKGEIPAYLELAFGTRDNRNGELGKIKAIELSLPGGRSISFQGKIDRIDKIDEDTYRIIDYKTGTPYELSRSKYFQNGKQIQHALYALSLKIILAKAGISEFPKIAEAGYYFPTLNGQGRQYFYGEERRERVLEIINILLDIVARGDFAVTQKAEDFLCKDYLDILEQNQVMEVSGPNAKKYDEEPALDNLRRLKEQYE